jgi:hypothetical protein
MGRSSDATLVCGQDRKEGGGAGGPGSPWEAGTLPLQRRPLIFCHPRAIQSHGVQHQLRRAAFIVHDRIVHWQGSYPDHGGCQ